MIYIGDPIESKDELKLISGQDFMKAYVEKFTESLGVVKRTDESTPSHLYKLLYNVSNDTLLVCKFF